MSAAALILAGGKSRRFGRDKTLLTLGGATLVERAVGHVRPLFDEILVAGSARKFHIPGTRAIPDLYPDAGPLGGIHSGLVHAERDALFVLACDMPNFDAALCERLLARSAGCDVFIPCAGEELEPLFGVYRKSALPAVERLLLAGRYRVRDLFPLVKTGFLPLEASAGEASPFFNINYAEDYEALMRAFKKD
ncbi:MAG TPA: molybdenum cofactor guanylyltransferase [Clostridia bacterium]|nr:MAG: putative molybdenum cofactor guanylyltransferase [Firmicutes bacterium ADurb.Bin248]HOG01075.1 molybdenum cofactor guanylyltransferase [Clostridia bacterium]HOS17926.1 molybdenum cofactor guanylyltransferase [Clostridia bacterium]HPK14949.1 molybdenum cofactor guanylyltransferase [Clostridia bacterium]